MNLIVIEAQLKQFKNLIKRLPRSFVARNDEEKQKTMIKKKYSCIRGRNLKIIVISMEERLKQYFQPKKTRLSRWFSL